MECDESRHVTRLFVVYEARKFGFNFCRPALYVDATFFKGTHKGDFISLEGSIQCRSVCGALGLGQMMPPLFYRGTKGEF